MRISRIIGEGAQSLGANKLRTFFMMAGTIVGIAALTVIMAMGEGNGKERHEKSEQFWGPRRYDQRRRRKRNVTATGRHYNLAS